jgi:uncharacterized protein YkwD
MVLSSQTKTPSIHHKKRNGRHHKVTKTYHKTYWPYLPLVAIIGLGIGANSLWAQASTHGVLGYSTDMSATELLNDTNTQRGSSNESSLALNAALDNAAQAKANDMVAQNYWSHDTPSGQPPWVFISAAGYRYVTAGENLAYGFDTSEAVINAWMASPEHRANVLNATYQDVGFGIANSTNYQNSGPETVVVAEYGQPAAPSATPVASASTAASSSSSSPEATSSSPAVTSIVQPTTPPSTAQPQATPTSPAVALNAAPVSRLQLLGDTTSRLSVFKVTIVAVLCFAIVIIRHGFIWRRVLRKGEKFAIRYHLLDVAFITIGVIGFIITRSAGYIH